MNISTIHLFLSTDYAWGTRPAPSTSVALPSPPWWTVCLRTVTQKQSKSGIAAHRETWLVKALGLAKHSALLWQSH